MARRVLHDILFFGGAGCLSCGHTQTVDLEKKVLELVKKKAVEWKQLGEE